MLRHAFVLNALFILVCGCTRSVCNLSYGCGPMEPDAGFKLLDVPETGREGDALKPPRDGEGFPDGSTPFSAGRWRFPREPLTAPTRSAPRCAVGGRVMVPWPPAPTANEICLYRGWAYLSTYHDGSRVRLADGRAETLTALRQPNVTSEYRMVLACRETSLIAAIYHRPTATAAIVEFEDPENEGVVRWSRTMRPSPSGRDAILIAQVVATASFMAWVWYEEGSPRRIFVAGPHAESPRVLAPCYGHCGLHASGNRLVYAHLGIYLWSPGMESPERLVSGNGPQQWSPWIDGDRVVWLDNRHTHGWQDRPDNPEVYFMDLRTREERRITNDPPERPAGQHSPVVEGDWIVWSDFRDAEAPNPPLMFTDRMDLYAYNLRTGRETRVLTGAQATLPRIAGDQLVYSCSEPDAGGQLFVRPMPTP